MTLTLGIATTHPSASCPACGGESQRVHSCYMRQLAEEPAFGRRVRLQMTVRRFLCPNPGCPRHIFVEPLDGLAAKHARTTTRLAQAHLAIGLALGGEAGARLARKTAMPTSPDSLLRRLKQAGARSSDPSARRHRRRGLEQGAALRNDRGRPRDERSHRPPARSRRRDRQGLARGPSRDRVGQPRPRVGLRPGGHRGRVQGAAGRRSMAPAEERARGGRTPVGAPSACHHGGPQARRSRSDE